MIDGVREPKCIFCGWLGFVAAQCMIAVPVSMADAATIILGLWSPRYAEMAPFFSGALFASAIAVALNVAATILLFARSGHFPSVLIASLVWRVGKIVFEILAIGHFSAIGPISVIESTNPALIINSSICAAVFIPYILLSKRVKTTFSFYGSLNLSSTFREIGGSTREMIGCFGISVFALTAFAGWCQHLYTCFNERLYGFLVAGAICFPIAIIHGWGIWLRFWN